MTGLGKRKKLGQHFLADQEMAWRIAEASGAGPGKVVVEIGPGKGALTVPLLKTGAEVVALELDRELFDDLTKTMRAERRLKLIKANALTFDYSSIPAPFLVASNLPYSVAAPIIKTLIEHKHQISSMVLMTQAEVARRLCANAGEQAYGSLSIYVNYHCFSEYLFDVPPAAFRPRPKVDSAVIRLIPRKEPAVRVDDEHALFELIRAAFVHRRKNIKNNLAGLWPDMESFLGALRQAGVQPTARAEELTIERFAQLYNSLKTP